MTTLLRRFSVPFAALAGVLALGCAPEPIAYPEGHPARTQTDDTRATPAPRSLEPHYVPPLPEEQGHHHHHHHAPQAPSTTTTTAPDASAAPPPEDQAPPEGQAPPATGDHQHVH